MIITIFYSSTTGRSIDLSPLVTTCVHRCLHQFNCGVGTVLKRKDVRNKNRIITALAIFTRRSTYLISFTIEKIVTVIQQPSNHCASRERVKRIASSDALFSQLPVF